MTELVGQSAEALGYRALRSIRRIIRQMSSHSRILARDTGLTLPQLLCMRAIDDLELEEVTLASVAGEVQLSTSTVSGVVERLVRAGLVTREQSRLDRRRVHLALTGPGATRLRESPRPLQDRFLARLAGLPRDEQERLLSALERVVELMDAEDLDVAPVRVPATSLTPNK